MLQVIVKTYTDASQIVSGTTKILPRNKIVSDIIKIMPEIMKYHVLYYQNPI